jgi:hypothetical protein
MRAVQCMQRFQQPGLHVPSTSPPQGAPGLRRAANEVRLDAPGAFVFHLCMSRLDCAACTRHGVHVRPCQRISNSMTLVTRLLETFIRSAVGLLLQRQLPQQLRHHAIPVQAARYQIVSLLQVLLAQCEAAVCGRRSDVHLGTPGAGTSCTTSITCNSSAPRLRPPRQ